MATHASILAWEIPWAEEPGRLQSMGSQSVRHNLETKHTHIYTHNYLSNITSSYPQTLYTPLFRSSLKSLNSINIFSLVFFFFLPHHAVCRILVSQPGIESASPAVEGQSRNHWTAREVQY